MKRAWTICLLGTALALATQRPLTASTAWAAEYEAKAAFLYGTGESPGFAERGGIVGFRTQDDRVRFDIDLRRAEPSGLRISSQLPKLATSVTTRP